MDSGSGATGDTAFCLKLTGRSKYEKRSLASYSYVNGSDLQEIQDLVVQSNLETTSAFLDRQRPTGFELRWRALLRVHTTRTPRRATVRVRAQIHRRSVCSDHDPIGVGARDWLDRHDFIYSQ